MAAASLLHRFLDPPRNPRLWVTFTWALTLAVGLAAWDWAEQRFNDAAAPTTMVLLPRHRLDESTRQGVQRQLQSEPGVLEARWIAPADLARRLAQRYPQSEWQELFPTDEGWLGWMMEVRPAAPLDTPGRLNDFAARRQKETTWRLVLWDPAPLSALARQRSALRITLGFWLGLVALGGVAALLRLPLPRTNRLGFVLWSALLGVVGPGAVWSAAVLAGVEPGVQALAIVMGAGFILATAVAPMLRLPQVQHHSLIIGEESNERIR